MSEIEEDSALIELGSFVDQRGRLEVGEFSKSLPFIVKRFFIISKVPPGEPRGIHAHKECHQLLICVSGSIKAMTDDGVERKVHNLVAGGTALHMPPLTWGAQYDYSDDAKLLVLASHVYDPEDYIHDFDEFQNVLANRNK